MNTEINNALKNKALQFQRLHSSGKTFIMPNAWNAGSAVLLQEAGFEAIATTSAGIAYAHALPDSADKLSFKVALKETMAIANSVNIPVSMDAENGYGDSPQCVFNNIKKIIASGVVGASIEDYSGDKSQPLYDIAQAKERIQAAKEASASLHYPFTLTARAECFLTGHPNALNESIKRVNQYAEVGADCLFVPGVKDIQTIQTLVRETNKPISVVMGLAGVSLSLAQLSAAGVTRISIGGSLARTTLGVIRQAAQEMLEKGTFNFTKQQIADDELCQLFQQRINKKHLNSG